MKRNCELLFFIFVCFYRLVTLFYVDTGVTDYADVRSICVNSPPMLGAIPMQALQCSLGGIKLVSQVKFCVP